MLINTIEEVIKKNNIIEKTINIAIFGSGMVGGTLINQIIENEKPILEKQKIKFTIFAIVNTRKLFLNKNGACKNWKQQSIFSSEKTSISEVISFAKKHQLENLIAVDNTASKDFVYNYKKLIEAGFNLVSSNKIANTLSFKFYKNIRKSLKKNNKYYFYETNVGAGLPVIDTVRLLHESGENITRIRGVFSGTLSYLFNNFSEKDLAFSQVLQEAIDKGYTEPDPREDLSGKDVGRKLLILARELDFVSEMNEVKIKNLIPESLQNTTVDNFLQSLHLLNDEYQQIKEAQKPNHVLRYIGELTRDLPGERGTLEVKLVSIPTNTPLGSLDGSDAIFEIYTESYGEQPIVIQGAGAGAEVTARGVFGDILRLSKSKI